MAQTPNLLYLISDDHANFAWGAGGDARAKTPHLDQLAAEGARFANCFCQYPVCTPSRQSFLTGKMPHAAGVTRLGTALEDGVHTLARHLKDHGYQTAASGKMHFNQESFDGLHGFDFCHTDKVHYTDSEFNDDADSQNKWRPFEDPARVWLNADGLPYPAHIHDMPNSKIADTAINWLENRDKEKPFALWTSFNQPHSPFFFPWEMAGMFKPQDFSAPYVPESDKSQIPLVFQSLSPEDIQGIQASYYTAIHFLDYNIGRMLAALREQGLEENTIVIYMTDHGYLTGQHGRIEKACMYDDAIKVPLVIKQPGQIAAGTVVEGLSQSLDVPGTLLELMGLPAMEGDQGQSLVTQIHNPDAKGHETIFSEVLENEEACIRSESWKLIYCSGKRARRDGFIEKDPTPGRTLRLFDLENDPDEFHNVAAEYPDIAEQYLQKMLAVFRSTHPEATQEAQSASIEDTLDWYLRPRD